MKTEEEEKCLESVGIITLDPIKIKKSEFFVDGENGTTKLHLDFGFEHEFFLPDVSDIIHYKGGKIDKLHVIESWDDFQIIEGWGDILIQSEDDVAGQIALLTSKQPKGEAGDLLNNGCSNLFYFGDVANLSYVSVWWDSWNNEWWCFSGPSYLGSNNIGARIFSPAV